MILEAGGQQARDDYEKLGSELNGRSSGSCLWFTKICYLDIGRR